MKPLFLFAATLLFAPKAYAQEADSIQAVSIQAVSVQGRRAPIKIEEGLMVFDVQRLTVGKNPANAYEAIAQTPVVTANGGRLSLTGVSTTIIVNGKPSILGADQLVQLLKSTPVERLERVETSYQAPAKWHVTGAAINIVLRYDPDELNGQTQAGYDRSARTSLYNGSGNLYVSGKRLSADVMANFRTFGGYGESSFLNEHVVQGVTHEIKGSSTSRSSGYGATLYSSLGYALKADKKLRLTYYSDWVPRRRGNRNTQYNLFDDTQWHERYDGTFHGATLAYESELIDAGASYVRTAHNMWQQYIFDSQTQINSIIDRLYGYADFSHTLTHNWKLGYGAAAGVVHNSNTFGGGQAQTLDEYNANAYASLSRQFKGGYYFSLNLKGDYYGLESYRKYRFLPSLSLSLPITGDHQLQYSLYASREDPSYEMQRAQSYYIDPYTLMTGNPAIRPATHYVSSLQYILKNRYVFSFFYEYVDRNIASDSYMSSTELVWINQPYNQRAFRSVALMASVPFRFAQWWQVQVQLVGKHVREKADDWHSLSYDLAHYNGQAQIDHYITLSQKPQIQLALRGYYSTASQQSIDRQPAYWLMNAGANWLFAGRRGFLSFSCNNIFESARLSYHSLIASQTSRSRQRAFRSFNLSFTWKFGNYNGTNMLLGAMDTQRAQ